MKGETYDVIVLGAGPAGAAAAALLAGKGRRIALIERRSHPYGRSSQRWISAGAADMLRELGVPTKPLLDDPIKQVAFHSADFAKAATPRFETTPGYLVARHEVENALVAAAVANGATLIDNAQVTNLRLKESAVVIGLKDDRELSGRLQLLAIGNESELLDRVGFTKSPAISLGSSAQVDVQLPNSDPEAPPRLELILGMDTAGSFGFCCQRGDRLAVCVNWKGPPAESMESLALLCKRAYQAGLIPVDPLDEPEHEKSVAKLGASALDLDTHVGKHTLLIGQAGGFIAAASYEGIYPSMWSAGIAADVADEALKSVHSQDELMTFNSKWRIKMAEYLRPPNTDSQFLLPLVFSNQPMTNRMGAAFFFGENI